MATITEDYCSFEISKLLKEKGFNEPIRCWYDSAKDFHESGVEMRNSDCVSPTIMCPTHQMAMKWLREVHNRFIEVCADKGHDFKRIVFRPAVYDKDLDCLWESDNYKSYEEAVEMALKYVLENLI